MKRYAKPSTPIDFTPKEKVVDLPISEISVARLIDDGLLVLHREMRNLVVQSSKGKLDAPSARDLRDTIKLLFELKEREDQLLKGITDQELEDRLKKDVKE